MVKIGTLIQKASSSHEGKRGDGSAEGRGVASAQEARQLGLRVQQDFRGRQVSLWSQRALVPCSEALSAATRQGFHAFLKGGDREVGNQLYEFCDMVEKLSSKEENWVELKLGALSFKI